MSEKQDLERRKAALEAELVTVQADLATARTAYLDKQAEEKALVMKIKRITDALTPLDEAEDNMIRLQATLVEEEG